MAQKMIAPPGTWKSNINASLVVNSAPRLADLCIQENGIFWLESIASEKGRMAIMRHHNDETHCLLPAPYNARSQVHEYGGAAFCVEGNTVFFVNAADQQIHSLKVDVGAHSPDATQAGSREIKALTLHPTFRFADLCWNANTQSLLAVCEMHTETSECENCIVSINMQGKIQVLASGKDFYANPRVSPSGNYLCWVSWAHPNMPWDQTQLNVVDATNFEPLTVIGDETPQSIVQPQWGPNDTLYFVSDRTDWWNIYALPCANVREGNALHPRLVRAAQAEYATPQWVFGMQHYAVISQDNIIAASTKEGLWHLELIDTNTGSAHTLLENTAWIDRVSYYDGRCVFFESQTDQHTNIKLIDTRTQQNTFLFEQSDPLKAQYSQPRSIFFQTQGAQTQGSQTQDALQGHAFFYEAHNTRYAHKGATPLIVLCHGGPTGQTSAGLNHKIQYWTNRGFAVVDINYRGSTGFGRPYRQALNKKWGLSDVEDMVTVVNHLVAIGKVDANKVITKGGSAGGYSVLAALTFTDTFAAGVSLYGIGDLELLAKDTHKFEKYYLDALIGKYPEEKQTYINRSPIHHTHKLGCALLLFQGLQDKVVPPNQARTMKQALESKGLPVSLIEYPDEGHGFRNPQNIEHMLETELAFYKAHVIKE